MIKNLLKKLPGVRQLHQSIFLMRQGTKDPKQLFTKCFEQNTWHDAESRSGTGSNKQVTHTLRTALPLLLEKYDIKTLLDLPCGDYHWMKEIDYPFLHYIGGDIVDRIVAQNNERYASETTEFRVINAIEDKLPRTDCLLARDLFVHFSFDDIERFLTRFLESGTPYLLTTHFCKTNKNHNSPTSALWRPLNLMKKPFYFPAPRASILEYSTEANNAYAHSKMLCLWDSTSVEAAVSKTQSLECV